MVNRISTTKEELDKYNWEEFFKEFQTETPRASAVLSAAFLDSLLRDLIASFMIENEEATNELLGTEKGGEKPLSGFGSRISTAFCLGLISRIEYSDLKNIKNIRNKFAHKIQGNLVDTEEVISLCDRLQTPLMFNELFKFKNESHWNKFIFAIAFLSQQIGVRILGIKSERRIVRDDTTIGQIIKT